MVAEALSVSGLTPDRLILEITESQLVGNTGPALSVLEDAAGPGHRPGHRRLRYRVLLAGLSAVSPGAGVETRPALLDGVGVEERATTLVRAVVGVAQALDLLVVAEGIEDLGTARILRDLGVWAGQGFALSPALTAPELLALVAERGVDLDVLRTRPLRRRPAATVHSDPRRMRGGGGRNRWRG